MSEHTQWICSGDGAADAVIIAGAGRELTRSGFATLCDELEGMLRRAEVAVLALHADNGPSWVVADAVSQRMQLCLVPLPTFFSPLQLWSVLSSCQATHLLTDNPDALCALVAETVGDPHPGTGLQLCRLKTVAHVTTDIPPGTGKITFTSGSTGDPRGVCLGNDQLVRQARSLVEAVALEQPRHLCLLPLSTLLENVAGVYAPLLAGGQVLVPSLTELGYMGSRLVHPEKMLALIQASAPETLILIPELLKLLVTATQAGWTPPDSFKFLAVGGSRVGQALLQQAWSLGLPVYEGYGLSECASVVTLNTRNKKQEGSCGLPLAHAGINIRDGEIFVSGNVMLGYVNDPQSWHQDEIATGDLGHFDEDGFLHLSGRRKNILISSYGRNISPEWPESELLANPFLQDAVVFGDARKCLVALVSCRDPRTLDDSIQLWIDRTNEGLPDYAQVRAWYRMPQPLSVQPGMLTGNGRPRREAIARQYARQIEALYGGDRDLHASLQESST